MPIPDNNIPLATMGEVQEKIGEPTIRPTAVGTNLRAFAKIADQRGNSTEAARYRTAARIIDRQRDLLSRISDLMRRCDSAKLKPGEERASDDEWISIEAEVNAAIGGASAPASRSTALPADVVSLVIAAREVAYGGADTETMKELDKACEAFAERVPWDNEPMEADHG